LLKSTSRVRLTVQAYFSFIVTTHTTTMKGRRKFTKAEAEQIRSLIKQKLEASTTEQKTIRAKIRKVGFHFSDFSNKKGYNVQDFDDLVSSGQITIAGHKPNPVASRTQPKEKPIQFRRQTKDEDLDPFEQGNFKRTYELDENILDCTGLYCLRLLTNSKLPERYQKRLNERNTRIIYIGKAEGQTLRERLSQELEHTSPGTFFRSIGAVLQFLPIPGHLNGKSNQKNYKFSPKDTGKIIMWLRQNIEVCIVELSGNFGIENDLIAKYTPILNHTGNPNKCQELIEDRAKCRRIAIG